MGFIQTQLDGHVLVARLAHGKANTLTTAVLEELHSVVQRVAEDDAIRAMVLASDVSRFFSAGFDIVQVFRYDADEMQSFFGKFIEEWDSDESRAARRALLESMKS